MIDRTPFSDIENKDTLSIRRLTLEDVIAFGAHRSGMVGIFQHPNVGSPVLIAVIDFDDMFDADGNRFYNDAIC